MELLATSFEALFLLAERDLSNMSSHSPTRIYLKKRQDVEAFHVIVGSDKEDSTKKFDQCCGKECTACPRGTLLPRILLALAIVLTLAGGVIYREVYDDYPVLPRIPVLPLLVGVPIIAFIMVFWLNAFRCCSRAAPKPCCCMRTLDGHLRCVYISYAVILYLFLGGLSFSLGGFGIDNTIAVVLLNLSFVVLIIGATSVTIYLYCQIGRAMGKVNI